MVNYISKDDKSEGALEEDIKVLENLSRYLEENKIDKKKLCNEELEKIIKELRKNE
jgi:septum formation inhibitor-activating ATPase MinD